MDKQQALAMLKFIADLYQIVQNTDAAAAPQAEPQDPRHLREASQQ